MRLTKAHWKIIATGLRALYYATPRPYADELLPLYRFALAQARGKRRKRKGKNR